MIFACRTDVGKRLNRNGFRVVIRTALAPRTLTKINEIRSGAEFDILARRAFDPGVALEPFIN